MLKLGVNIDHVATLRQARLAVLPDPVEAALECERAGAHGITAHLREDRRHIQDADMESLRRSTRRLNMEMAVTEAMVVKAIELQPHCCCLVPEQRLELTTEGGLDVLGNLDKVAGAVAELAKAGIEVSLFIDPEADQIRAAAESGAPFIELHTGSFANANGAPKERELERLATGAALANQLGLQVNAGHGIDYENIADIMTIPDLRELNIGHSIVARAMLVGIFAATREILDLMAEYP